ncbi:MAG: HAMP domain-containing histidine kinase [Methylotenera sp.]|nr:HAMP domain-containing histidine kinase [Oligoflexia bacterium]
MISRLKKFISRFTAPSKDQLLQIQKGNSSQNLHQTQNSLDASSVGATSPSVMTEDSFQLCSLRDLIREVVQETRSMIAGGSQKRVEMDTSVQDVHVLLKMQRPRLKKVLGSLLENSVKSMGENGMLIIRVAKSEGFVAVHLLDNGKGYADLGEVRALPSVAQAQALLTSWSGDVVVASAVGKGTKVTLKFPVKTPVKPVSGQKSGTNAGQNART